MTERIRLWIQVAEMGFLRKVAGVSLRDKVRSPVIPKLLRVEPLLLCVERSHLGWFRHLVRMPPSCLTREAFQACPAGKRPTSRWKDYISALKCECPRIPQSELADVAREREVWLPPDETAASATQLDSSAWLTMERWIDGWIW